MGNAKPDLRTIFCEAMELQSPAEVNQYLDEACGDDVALRQDVLTLLKSHDAGGNFLGGGIDDVSSGAPRPDSEVVQIGPYKLREKIGEGGMGEVYVAEQTEPVRRKVAIKVIKPGMDSREVIARFEAERQALALMDHPNIAKVLDGGSTETGRPYFVMELVRGIPVIQYCDQQKLPTHKRLDLFIKVCHAIQHAHQKGIIHRDIKPSNVLITLHDGVPVPRVIDFGIAKATQQELTAKTIYTRHHQFIGTPAYMSPEQAEMSGLGIDTRSDIYSLGVLLYEMLTGMTPFDEKQLLQSGIDEMRKIIREQEPLRPSTKFRTLQMKDQSTTASRQATEAPKLISLLQGDLDWIVMKCLEKDRSRRYDTANGLASDIARHLSDEPVTARPPTAAYKLQKAWRRNKVVYTAASMVVASLMVGISLSLWQAWVATVASSEAHALRESESVLREEAEARARSQRLIAYSADMKLAREYLKKHRRTEARKIFDRYVGEEDLQDIEWYYLRETLGGDETYTVPHETEVRGISLSSDGARLASITMSGKVRLFEVATPTYSILQQHGGGSMSFGVQDGSVALSPDGRYLAAEQQGILTVWDADTAVVAFKETNVAAPVCFSPDSQYLAGVTETGLQIWRTADWNSGALLETSSEVDTSELESLAFTPDSRHVIFSPSRFASKVIVHNLDNDAIEGELTGLARPQVICTDGSIVVAGGRDGQVCAWDLATRDIIKTFKAHRSFVVAVALSPDGKTLATGGNESEIRLWDTETFKTIGDLKGHHSQIWNLKFSGNGRRLASASMDQSVKLWDWQQKIQVEQATAEPAINGPEIPKRADKRYAPRIHTVTSGDSIQATVDAAMPGDRIDIVAGIHEISETIHVNKPLIIRGAARNRDDSEPLPTVLKGAEGLAYVMHLETEVGSVTEIQDLQIETSSSGIQHLSGDFTLRGCQVIIRSVLEFQKVISLESMGFDNHPTDTVTIDGCTLSAEYVGDTAARTPPDADIVLAAPNTRYVKISVTRCDVTNEVPNAIANGIETRGTTAQVTIGDNRFHCLGMGIVLPNHIGAVDIRDNTISSTYVGILAGTESPKPSNIVGNHITIDEQNLQIYPDFVRELIARASSSCIRIGSTSAGVAAFFGNKAVIGRGTNFLVEQNELMGNPKHGIALVDSLTPESHGPPTPNHSHDNVIARNDFTDLDAEWDIALGSSTSGNLIVDNVGVEVEGILTEAGDDDRNIIHAD